MQIFNLNDAEAFETKDGSEIRELLNPANSDLRLQSLAEARLTAGQATAPHYHLRAEEIYYILDGRGEMTIGDETRPVGAGDAIAIPPGSTHQIRNTGQDVLRILCCCSPPYEHADTVLTGSA